MTPDEAVREIARLDFELDKADAAARVEYQTRFAEQALKTLLLVNGGSIIALFTFIGNIGKATSAFHIDASQVWWAFVFYVGGLAATLIAYLLAYLSQGFFYTVSMNQAYRWQAIIATGKDTGNKTEPHFSRGNKAQISGVAIAAIGMLAFVIGSGFALAAVL